MCQPHLRHHCSNLCYTGRIYVTLQYTAETGLFSEVSSKRGGKWITHNLPSLDTSLLKPPSAAYNLHPQFLNLQNGRKFKASLNPMVGLWGSWGLNITQRIPERRWAEMRPPIAFGAYFDFSVLHPRRSIFAHDAIGGICRVPLHLVLLLNTHQHPYLGSIIFHRHAGWGGVRFRLSDGGGFPWAPAGSNAGPE